MNVLEGRSTKNNFKTTIAVFCKKSANEKDNIQVSKLFLCVLTPHNIRFGRLFYSMRNILNGSISIPNSIIHTISL